MNIEELEQIKQDIKAVYNVMYNFDDRLCDDMQVRVKRIETLLTAYENLKSYNKGTKEALRVAEDLEHQANKEAGDWEARYFELEAELEKEKEKNKELIKERATEIVYVDRNFIRKDKIKPIQIIDLDGKIHNVYKIEEE